MYMLERFENRKIPRGESDATCTLISFKYLVVEVIEALLDESVGKLTRYMEVYHLWDGYFNLTDDGIPKPDDTDDEREEKYCEECRPYAYPGE